MGIYEREMSNELNHSFTTIVVKILIMMLPKHVHDKKTNIGTVYIDF